MVSTRRLQGRSLEQFQNDLTTAIQGEHKLMSILQKQYGIKYRRTACGESDELIDEKQVKSTPDYQIQLPPLPQWFWLELKELYKAYPYITFKVHQLKNYIKLRSYVLIAYGTGRKNGGDYSPDTRIAVVNWKVLQRIMDENPIGTFSCFPGVPSIRIYEPFDDYFSFRPLFPKDVSLN